MVREKRTNLKRFPPIDIDLDDPQQKRLWEVYQSKTKRGEAARWVRDTLIAALPADASTPIPNVSARPAVAWTRVIDTDDDVRYEPIEGEA